MLSNHPYSRRRLAVAATVAGTLLAATACGSTSDPTEDVAASDPSQSEAEPTISQNVDVEQCGEPTRTIEHNLGETTITGDPERVVALEGSFVDALVWTGVMPIGFADDDNDEMLLPELREPVGDYTSVGLRATPNLQVITSLKPDLIIADSDRHDTIYDQLSQIAPTVAFSSNTAGYQDMLDSQMLVAVTMNRCEEVEARLAEHAETMTELKAQVPADEDRAAMFCISIANGFKGQTAGAFAPGVMEVLGLAPVLQPDGDDVVADLTLETLLASAPDIMFVAYDENSLGEQWASNQLWQQIPAIENDAHFEVDRIVWSKSRGLVAAETIAREVVENLYES